MKGILLFIRPIRPIRLGLICLALISYSLLTTHYSLVNAAQTITVTPQISRIDLAADTNEAIIYYKNGTGSIIDLELSIKDITELEDRSPVILEPQDAKNYKYSLSSWVYLEKQSLTLNPGETRSVKVTINGEKLSPGGHYGTVLAEIKQKEGDKKVKLRGILASLLFVRASTGNEIEEAKINYFGLNQRLIQFPKKAIFRFQNTGNVDLIPYGLLEIKDPFGRIVAKGIVNEDSLITLPEAIRTYNIPVSYQTKFMPPGNYTATLSLHYGKSGKTITQKTAFLSEGSTSSVWLAVLAVVSAGGFIVLKRKLRKK